MNFAIKKTVSLMLVLLMGFSVLTVVQASDSTSSQYVMADISSAANAEVYKDETDMTYDVASSSSDYFPYGSTYYWRCALKKDSVAAQLTDGIAYDNSNVPYSMPLEKAINPRGTYSPSITVDIVDGEYKKLYFLGAVYSTSGGVMSFRAILNYTDGSTSYVDYNADNFYDCAGGSEDSIIMTVDAYKGSWSNKTTGTNSMATSTMSFNINTYAVPVTSGKVLDSVTFTSGNAHNTAKILAITAEKMNFREIVDELESLITDGKYAAAQSLLAKIEARTDADAVAWLGTDEYINLKDTIEANITFFKPVDISSVANAEAYKDGTDMTYNVASSSIDYFPYGSTYYWRCALKKDSIESQMTDGIAYDSANVPYSMPLQKAINPHGTVSPSITLDIEDAPYSKVHFLGAVHSKSGGVISFRATLNYTDGSTSYVDYDSNNFYAYSDAGADDSLVMTADAYSGSWTNISTGTNTMSNSTMSFNIHTYAIPATRNKVLDSVTFSSSNGHNTAKILAVTLETQSLDSMISYIEEKIADLDALKDDISSFETVSGLIGLLEENDVDTTQINNYSEFIYMKDRMVNVAEYTVETDAENVTVTVEFTVAVADVTHETIQLFKNDSAFASEDYSVEMLNEKTVKVTFLNTLDYVSQHKIVLSEDIESAVDSAYTLGKDVEIVFVPEAQTKISSFEVYDNDGAYATLAAAAGKTVTAKTVIEGDAATDFLIALYDADNMMQTLAYGTTEPENGTYTATATLTVPENVQGYSVESYVFDNSDGLKLLYPKAVVK